MKRIFVVLGASALLFSTAAAAADVDAPLAYDWSGAYIGLNAGAAWGDSTWSNSRGSYLTYDTSGFLLGGQIGYRAQMDRIVLGVEGSADWAHVDGSGTLFSLPYKTKQNFRGSVEGQLGFAADRVLVYGTGGLVFGNFSHDYFDGSVWTTWPGHMKAGWTLGAGVDYAMTDNMSVGVRYNHDDFGRYYQFGSDYSADFSETSNLVTLRLNYKF